MRILSSQFISPSATASPGSYSGQAFCVAKMAQARVLHLRMPSGQRYLSASCIQGGIAQRFRIAADESAGRRLAACSQSIRTKFTMASEAPMGAKFVGYHGTTDKSIEEIAQTGIDFTKTGKNFFGRSRSGPGLYVTKGFQKHYYAENAAQHRPGSKPQQLAVYRKASIPVNKISAHKAYADPQAYAEAHELGDDYAFFINRTTVILPKAIEDPDIEYIGVPVPLEK